MFFVKNPGLPVVVVAAMQKTTKPNWDRDSLAGALIELGDEKESAISRAEYLRSLLDDSQITTYVDNRRRGIVHETAYSHHML